MYTHRVTHWVYYTVSAPNEVKLLKVPSLQVRKNSPCEADLLRSSCHSLNQSTQKSAELCPGLGSDRKSSWRQRRLWGFHGSGKKSFLCQYMWELFNNTNDNEWMNGEEAMEKYPNEDQPFHFGHCNGLLWRLEQCAPLLAVSFTWGAKYIDKNDKT